MPCSSQEVLVNLDYAASTPMRPEAVAAERSFDSSELAGANPNSLHTLGRRAASKLEEAKRGIAASLGKRVRTSEIILTGGGTEANHLGLLGIAEGVRNADPKRVRVVVSAIEHDSILDNLSLLSAQGFQVTLVRPQPQGTVDPNVLRAHMDTDVALVSVMLANNETGAVQPVSALCSVAHEFGARFFTDAIQGYLHIPIDVDAWGVDALSLAGHKVGAGVSTGALFLRSRCPLRPRVFGGGQEAGRRAGTQDLRGALALAAVARTLAPRIESDRRTVQALADELYRRLCAHRAIDATVGAWEDVERLPGIVSIVVDGWESEDLILALDAAGFAVSAGSACSSGNTDASHVLTAMGMPRRRAQGSLRISFDDRVDPAALARFADTLLAIVGNDHAR